MLAGATQEGTSDSAYSRINPPHSKMTENAAAQRRAIRRPADLEPKKNSRFRRSKARDSRPPGSCGIRCRWRELKALAANGKTGGDAHRPKGGGVPRASQLEPDQYISGRDAHVAGF